MLFCSLESRIELYWVLIGTECMSCQLMYVDSDGCPRAGAVCAHDRGEYIIRDASGGGPGDDRVCVFRLAAYDIATLRTQFFCPRQSFFRSLSFVSDTSQLCFHRNISFSREIQLAMLKWKFRNQIHILSSSFCGFTPKISTETLDGMAKPPCQSNVSRGGTLSVRRGSHSALSQTLTR